LLSTFYAEQYWDTSHINYPVKVFPLIMGCVPNFPLISLKFPLDHFVNFLFRYRGVSVRVFFLGGEDMINEGDEWLLGHILYTSLRCLTAYTVIIWVEFLKEYTTLQSPTLSLHLPLNFPLRGVGMIFSIFCESQSILCEIFWAMVLSRRDKSSSA